ncbi:MAG: glycerol kinase, partial [Rhodospirillaceae bacterium]|nr:glycerol kinase [Rhodospirillaceae bacterium]
MLALDQGTTSCRAVLFGPDLEVLNIAQKEFAQHFPDDGWVEHDAMEILGATLATGRAVIESSGIDPSAIAA